MRPSALAVAVMLAAACLTGSGCFVAADPSGRELRVGAGMRGRAAERGQWSAGCLRAEELASAAPAGESLSPALVAAEGRFSGEPGHGYYGEPYYPDYYGTPGETFIYAVLGIALTVALVAFIANNSDSGHVHTSDVDIYW